MKRSTQSLLILLLLRMVRRGGPLRWLAVAAVLVAIGAAWLRPDLFAPQRSGEAQQPRVSRDAAAEAEAPGVPAGTEVPFDAGDATAEVTRDAPIDESLEVEAEARRTTESRPRASERPAADESTPLLETLRGGTLRSPAGLLYARGSEQGHRLQHVLTHGHDEPNRPGAHGVFRDGSEEAVVRLIDEAYRQAQTGRGTQRDDEDGRTVLTIDMRRPIGYLGGQTGQRRGHPSARHLRLVLEQQRVITAYPIIP